MFQDRQEAGQRLGARLTEDGITADIVLGIPRGALPVARPVADVLDVPLDIVVASKIGAPHNPELAIGAVASDGTRWLNDDLIDRLGVDEDYIETEGEREAANAHEKVEQYRTEDDEPDLSDRAVIIVDDGVATGATARACCRQATEAGARHVVLAVPVGSPDSLRELESEADQVIALQEPQQFRAVGQFYETFGQVSDDEAISHLKSGGKRSTRE